ncbi:3-oxoacid CoA-transferase subunit B [Bacillus sp. V2I10]|uniref:3-oxoacid CoA-transferase subunit B n=1 Tax=Bacillus sp. V2I10 TaxID=3042276 RepID=UPI002785358B|nr:3-oxoacid CoA-transferase subunit B [Bacillus sp. V2I10]MDQ0859040.1 acetate CoA/acetoacetate CoA-transferase beta subunit [Bacillus sp. V2I10]
MGMGIEVRENIAKRAAQEIDNGMIVNLGIGIPSLVPNYLKNKPQVMIQAENGILGIGPTPLQGEEEETLCNAAGYPVTLEKGASYFDTTTAFGMIRRGCIDLTILGSLQVSEKGDLANWIVPGKRVPGMGGAMELAGKAKKVIVVMNHVNKNGDPKILTSCTLPLTSKQCVDLIITDMAVIEVHETRLILKEIMVPFTVQDVMKSTGAKLEIGMNL